MLPAPEIIIAFRTGTFFLQFFEYAQKRHVQPVPLIIGFCLAQDRHAAAADVALPGAKIKMPALFLSVSCYNQCNPAACRLFKLNVKAKPDLIRVLNLPKFRVILDHVLSVNPFHR